MRTLAERLKATREEGGLSQSGLAKLAAVSQTTVANIESGRNQGSKHLLAIAGALGVTPQWLLDESGPKYANGTRVAADPTPGLFDGGKGGVTTWESKEDLEPDDHRVWIDRYDYHFSAGSGLIQWEVRQKKALPFDVGFFKALGSNPKDCKLLIVRGDSMEPFLFNRDTMMVDTAKTRIKDGGIYAIYFEDEPLVKRIYKQAGGGIVLNSYNSIKYPDKEIPPDKMEYVKVVGEFIHRSGSGPAGGN